MINIYIFQDGFLIESGSQYFIYSGYYYINQETQIKIKIPKLKFYSIVIK